MTADVSSSEIQRIGRYRVTGEIGRGGMGVVYQGEDRLIGRRVAIKTLTEVTPELRERFYIEAKSGILSHPNIVTVYEVGEHEGSPFIAMEFVEGKSLEQMLRLRRRLPLLEAISIVEQLCTGLGYAHEHGVLHRDVKPANVLVRPDGRVTIVDFGIARLADQTRQLTRTNTLLGTFHYISPERLKGEASDGRADIWSVGVIFYEMLTGELPFKGGDISSLYRVIHEPFVPLVEHLQGLPDGLNHVFDKALAKQVDARYGTAEEMALDLRALAEELKHERMGDLLATARQLTDENQYASARTMLMQVQRIDPGNSETKTLLGNVQDRLREAIEIDPGHQEVQEEARAPHKDAQSREQLEDTQEFLKTTRFVHIPVSLEQTKSTSSSAEAMALLEKPSQNHAKSNGQRNSTVELTEVLTAQPTETQGSSSKQLEEARAVAETKAKAATDRRAAEIRKAVVACEKEITAGKLDNCMRPLEALAKQYGESVVLAAKRTCESKREHKATQMVREVVQAAGRQLRSNSARKGELTLKKAEYALSFANAGVRGEWQRLKRECADAQKPKQPVLKSGPSSKRVKAKWYAAGSVAVLTVILVATLLHQQHEATAAQNAVATSVPPPILQDQSPASAPIDLEINASPWATVLSIQDQTGNNIALPDGDPTTPLRLEAVNSGIYKVTFAGADGKQQTVECNVSASEHLCVANMGIPDTTQVLMGGQP